MVSQHCSLPFPRQPGLPSGSLAGPCHSESWSKSCWFPSIFESRFPHLYNNDTHFTGLLVAFNVTMMSECLGRRLQE